MSSDNLTDSPDGPICSICFNKLNDTPYAMINDTGETGKYHIQCLEQWIQKSNRGTLIDKKTDTYSIYHDDKLIEIIINNKPYQIADENQSVQINITETTVLIPDENIEDDSDSGREYPCYMQFNKGQIMCAGIGLLFIFSIILFTYLTKHK